MTRKTSASGGDYVVGYKRPPVGGQFQKGAPSRNPKGRPKGARNVSTILAAELAEEVQVRENGKPKKITKAEVIIKNIVNSAGNGDVRAQRLLVEMWQRSGELGASPEAADDLPSAREQAALDAYVERARRRKAS